MLVSKSRFLILCLPLLLSACALHPGGRGSSPVDAGPICETSPGEMADLSDLLESAPEAGSSEGVALKTLGYAAQVGAFSSMENAARLEEVLREKGIDAYSFRHESGLYKVRFGDHPTYDAARQEAQRLREQGGIGEYFIVTPDQYAVARSSGAEGDDRDALREELVRTARRFLGVRYQWGGTSAEKGFDCSGLTMVSYRLNGLNLPRVSYQQHRAGRAVSREGLRKGDLVFFATGGGKRVSHVGMYIGDGQFIHAPRKGKDVRVARLSNSYWRRVYVGGRTYL